MNLIANLKPKFNLPAQITIDKQLCVQCGLCQEVCPYGLPQPDEDGFYSVTHRETCVECEACARNCPVGAIQIKGTQGCGCIWCGPTTGKDNKQSCC